MPFIPMDSTIIYLIPAMILAFYAQYKVKATFNKYSKLCNRRGYTGKDLAERMLRSAGLYDVQIEAIRGSLTDHYDPKGRVLRLSEPVYNSTSLAALGVAAHECGHAIQHDTGYAPIMIRNFIVPVVNIGSQAAMPMVFLGLILGFKSGTSLGYLLVQLGIILFTAVVIFQFVTLPVELNASSRAIQLLRTDGYLDEDELKPAKRVLSAAALTYIAAAAVALANLIRLLAISRRRN